uniref:Syntaxin 12 n=1 Tax=Neolamprologus brichardi TaxID=32507 RepID=A0A3Q4G2D1_NEOBR
MISSLYNYQEQSAASFLCHLYIFLPERYHCVPMTAAQIKTMVNQLGTRQDTSELQDRLYRQQKIQRDRLMNDFSAALNNFQAVQRRAAEKEKESVARARAGSRLSWGQMTTQTEEVVITEEDLELIKERETNIRQLESDIMDVNQIFKDLAVMIHDQGEMIDSIEANVENAEVHVERGTEQLQRAAYYQQKSRKKICILVMVCAVVLVILSVIIWWAAK